MIRVKQSIAIVIGLCLQVACTHSSSQPERYSWSAALEGYDVDVFDLQLTAGQTLSMQLSNRFVQAIIIGPDQQRYALTSSFAAKLSGLYQVHVMQPRAQARRGEVQFYQLTITLSKIADD